MSDGKERKVRGFVMTGGGAKGFYEAGVIHAFHITGMEFDVITGSSIGAMNSVFFAEYLLKKRSLPDELKANPEAAIEAMERLIRQYHHAWLLMPTVKIIDDSETGPLGKLKNDLLHFKLSLPQIVRLGWWWSDPERGQLPSLKVVSSGLHLVKELIKRLGNVGQVFRIFKDHRSNLLGETIRTYLAKFGISRSLVPDQDDRKLKDLFTAPVTPLNPEHLSGNVIDKAAQDESGLIDVQRTMKDYLQAGIDVRLTRANYRTGRLEISNYLSMQNFVRWLERQAWRLRISNPNALPLGSFRIQMPGNPNALNAALASGRFPGVFCPYPITSIYPADVTENKTLHDMLANWVNGERIQAELKEAYLKVHAEKEDVLEAWERTFKSYQSFDNLKAFFANLEDTYVDGGAIDNTPTNSVVDAVRESIAREGGSKREATLEMYVIFLYPEPKVDEVKDERPTTFDVVRRTLGIQGAAKLSSDSVTVKTINHFGSVGEDLGEALLTLVESVKAAPNLDLHAVETALREKAQEKNMRGFLGKDEEGILERLESWSKKKIGNNLPLHVSEIAIYPEKMPLDTLQFSERLGYRKKNAIEMISMGCYNTLWAMREHLETQKESLDDHDQQVLDMTKRWMDIEEWPQSDQPEQLDPLYRNWKCKRTQCLYHAEHCPHGLGKE
ncbi:MAG: patatin-like phospholipase family protein [Anaerolineaceae bacterium]|nr:patatin-like phospholipase family protein [Anaerolineaceae bacterium]